MLKITRKEALEQGLKRYYTGRLCPQDHDSERLISDRSCIKCSYIKALRLEKLNPNRKGDRHSAGHSAKIRALKKTRIPIWCDLEEIQKIYKECRDLTKFTGIKHQVDHIIPLQGKLVCGLHVSNNLQILTASENCSKSNKFEII